MFVDKIRHSEFPYIGNPFIKLGLVFVMLRGMCVMRAFMEVPTILHYGDHDGVDGL